MNSGECNYDEREVEVKREKVKLIAHKGRWKTQPWRAIGSFRGMSVEGKGRTADEAFRDWERKAGIL